MVCPLSGSVALIGLQLLRTEVRDGRLFIRSTRLATWNCSELLRLEQLFEASVQHCHVARETMA